MHFLGSFRKAFYLFVFIGFSSAQAGSYEDFFIAIQRDHPDTVTSLLKQGFDPNTLDPKGRTGLMLALQQKSFLCAAALLEAPALQVDALNDAGESALMLTVLRGELEMSQKLLARGAKVQLPGWSPLHYAASGPSVQAVALLLDRGADVNAGSPNGSTALMMAARYGSEDSVDLLLARGADPKRRNERDLSAADFARLGGREKLTARLQALLR